VPAEGIPSWRTDPWDREEETFESCTSTDKTARTRRTWGVEGKTPERTSHKRGYCGKEEGSYGADSSEKL